MKRNSTIPARAMGLLLAAAALPASAIAQEAQPVTPPAVTPPPVVPEASAPAPAPVPASSPSPVFAAPSPVVQAVPPPAQVTEPEATTEPETAPEAAAEPAVAPARRANRARAAAPTPAPAATPVSDPAAAMPESAIPAAADMSAIPAPESVTPVTPPIVTPEAAPVSPATTQPSDISSGSAWALLGGTLIVILGLIGYLLVRRRRNKADTFDETYYAPAEEAPAAAMQDGAASRPWIDIGLRPVRAEDSLEIEVTVSNSGDAPAHDVRVSTWMLNGTESPESEQMLIEARAGAQVATVDVAPGSDKSVDTTLALPAEANAPILVAEARYPLPGGGEGRIAASFEIDANGKPGDVEARLHDVIERA